MIELKGFKAIRPKKHIAHKVAELPYDVMNRKEAKEKAKGNPYSFLHIDKAEIDLDSSIDTHDLKVYEKARDNLLDMRDKNIFIKDKKEKLYIYKQVMGEKEQVGIVGSLSIDDYINNKIKKHENTLKEKVIDRTNHIKYCNANTGPIFLTYRSEDKINNIVKGWIERNKPLYDFKSEDDIFHKVWVINDEVIIENIIDLFKNIKSLYIADGHHRTAAAQKVYEMRKKKSMDYTGKEEYNYFLGVLFPHDMLNIMDYNRVIKDLNGLSKKEFIKKVKENFTVTEIKDNNPYKTKEKHVFGMYLEDTWFKLKAKETTFKSENLVKNLDVSILQDNILNYILGIEDPSNSKRIDFVGGIRGLKELEKRVKEGMKVAFSMYPTDIEDLLKVSDEMKIMPPKSTWFEPKLLSGLFLHDLE